MDNDYLSFATFQLRSLAISYLYEIYYAKFQVFLLTHYKFCYYSAVSLGGIW